MKRLVPVVQALLGFALLVLNACTTPRPPSQVCRGFGLTGDTALPAGDSQTGPIAAEVERLLNLRAPTARGPIVVNYLVLSTGGQYGAFGSGFLRGWGENLTDPRPQFDIVTGASAGGVIAPFALAGQGFDESLTLNAGIGTDDVLRRRSPLEMLTSTSIMDISGFETRIRTAITPALVAQLAQNHAQGRSAFVGTVNLDTNKLVKNIEFPWLVCFEHRSENRKFRKPMIERSKSGLLHDLAHRLIQRRKAGL